MSLQVWLPLTKDLHNQGLANVSITNNGATYSSTGGKLGGCYSFDGSNDNLAYTPNVDGLETFSIALWLCPTTSTPTGAFFSLERDTYWQVTFNGVNVGIRDDSIGWNGTRKNYSSGTYTANIWTHLAVTYNKGILKIYRDGNLLSTNTVGGTKLNTGINNARVGSAVQDGYYYAGKINDVRFYNHCLSEKEIKKISRGLILHYPLNKRGLGNENLLANTDFNGTSKKYTLTSGSEGGFTYTPTETIVANTEYIVSCRLRGNANMNLYKLCTGGNEALNWINRSQLSTTEYRPFSIVFTYPSNKTLNQIYICTRYGTASSQVGDWFEIEPYSLKLEIGNKVTPWCPNTSDTLYSSMNLNSSTIYDYSGFNNNGEITGTLGVNSDSPKYNCSTSFPSGANFIRAGRGAMVNDSITVNLWAKWSTWGNPISCTEGGGWNFENGSSSIRFPVYVSGVGYKLAESGVAPGTLANQWHMLTGTFDKTNVKIYIDGILKGITATGSTNGIGYPSNNVIFVAAESAGNNTTPESNAFVGNISDVRIYATALSATDVLSLYQNNAYIDESGQIYGPVREV